MAPQHNPGARGVAPVPVLFCSGAVGAVSVRACAGDLAHAAALK